MRGLLTPRTTVLGVGTPECTDFGCLPTRPTPSRVECCPNQYLTRYYATSHPNRPHLRPPVSRSVAEGGAEDGPRVQVELGVHSLSTATQPLLDRTLERLALAVEAGTVLEHDVFVANVRDWATCVDATLDLCFYDEPVECALTGGSHTRVRFPTVCLSEYHDGELAFVAAARVRGERAEAADRLDRLLAGEPESSPGVAVASE